MESKYDTTTPKYFKILDTKLSDDTELDTSRNPTNFKHAMVGPNIWNSLIPDFQLELLGQESECERDN